MRALAAALLVCACTFPAPAAASGDEPELPAVDLDAWRLHSKRAHELKKAGWGIVGTATAFALAGLAINIAVAASSGHSEYDDEGGSEILLLIGVPFFCNASVLYGIGFGLLGSGWREAARAGKLGKGELTAADLSLRPRGSRDPRKHTLAGMALTGASLGILAGAWIGWSMYFAGGATSGQGGVAYLVLYPVAMSAFGFGCPFVLSAGARARQDVGLSGRTGLAVSGWVFYALSLASVPMFWGFRIPYIGIAGSGFLAIAAALTFAAGARTLDGLKGDGKPAVSIVPFASPAPGGAVAGVAGSF